MKTIRLSLMTLALAMMSFSYAPFSSAVKKAIISWKSTEVKLGDIPQGVPVDIEFTFTNTGDAPILITSVQAGCGCTIVDYSKTPVNPGQTSQIKATFNAAKAGSFSKTVQVSTNAEENLRILTFSGTVLEKKAE